MCGPSTKQAQDTPWPILFQRAEEKKRKTYGDWELRIANWNWVIGCWGDWGTGNWERGRTSSTTKMIYSTVRTNIGILILIRSRNSNKKTRMAVEVAAYRTGFPLIGGNVG